MLFQRRWNFERQFVYRRLICYDKTRKQERNKDRKRITEGRKYNFNMLSQKYQAEQEELDQKIQKLKVDMSSVKETAENAEKWIELFKKVGYPEELTAELLNTLIEKILIHEATEGEFGGRDQEIEIIYRFVGKID